MDDIQVTQREQTPEPKLKWVEFEGDMYQVEDYSEPPSPVKLTNIRDLTPPRYSDGTFFPRNYLEHETVIGYLGDRWPSEEGVNDILEVVSIFEAENLRCCIFEVMALQYYGSERWPNDWWICVPTRLLSKAAVLLGTKSQKYLPFAPDCRAADKPEAKWPRFKLSGLKLFVLLVPADAVRFAIDREDSIIRGKTGLPFPSLPAFVQSLLDSQNFVDLEDLIDAMNLEDAWAAANGVEVSDEPYPGLLISPKRKWESSTRTKQKRLGWKYNPKIYATRYRTHKDQDPTKTGQL